MDIMNLFRPKWKHSNYRVRIAAIKKLTDQLLLADIIKNDRESDVRKAAVEKLTNQRILAEIAKADPDKFLRRVAVWRLTDQHVLVDIAKNDCESDVCKAAVEKLTDQALLADVAKNASEFNVRKEAVEKLTDQVLLANIIKNDKSNVRKTAVEKLTDQRILAEIAKADTDEFVRGVAVEKLTDQRILAEIAKADPDKFLRRVAVEKLTDQRILAEIAKADTDEFVRGVAVEKLTDQVLLVDVAKTGGKSDVRKASVEKITDQCVLAEIAKADPDEFVHRAAVEKLTDQALLADIVRNASNRLKILGCEEMVKAIQDDPERLRIIFKDPFLNDEKFWADKTKINQLLKDTNDVNKCFGMKDNQYNDYFTELKGTFKGIIEVIKRIKDKYSGEAVQYVFVRRGADLLYYGMKFMLEKESKSKCHLVNFLRFGPDCIKGAYEYPDDFKQYINSIGFDKNKKVVIVGAYSAMPEFTFYKIGALLKGYGFTKVDVIDATDDIAMNEEQSENKKHMIRAMMWLNERYVEGRQTIVQFGDHIMEFYDMRSLSSTLAAYKINNNGKYWGWLNRKEFYDYIIREYHDRA